MSRRMVCSLGLYSGLRLGLCSGLMGLGALVAGAPWASAQPVTPSGPMRVPEGGLPDEPKAAGGEETGRAAPPRALPADGPTVLRPSPTGTPGEPVALPDTPPASTDAAEGEGEDDGGPPAEDGEAQQDDAAAEPAEEPAAPEEGPAQPSSPVAFRWRPFGFLRAQLAAVRQDPDVAFVGRSDGFSLQNARVGVRGELGERARFEISIDGAVDERDRVNVPNGRLRVGLRDAYVELGELSALPVALSLRVGRFEAWFDPDGYAGDTERQFVDRALESRGVSATEGWETAGLPPGRSLGVAVRARFWPRERGALARGGARLFGEATVMNGADEFASGNDNDAVALSGALRLILPSRAWAQAAYRYNPRTEGDLPFQQEEVDSAFSLGAGLSLGRVSVAAGGVLQYTRFATTGGPNQRAWGAHGQAMVRVLGGAVPLDAGYRFGVLDPSSLVVTDRVMEHSLGAVFTVESLRARLQVNATHAVEQEARQLTNDRLEVVFEVRL